MSDLPAPVSGGGSHHLGDNSENAKAPASQSVSTDTANAQDNSLLSDMSSERTVERDGTANASHSQLKSVSEATKKDHGPLAPSNENSPVLVDRKDASTPPAVPEKDKATGSATGGGAEGSHDMEQGPLKTVAEGGATDKAAIVDASEKLRTTNAKGDTDDPDLKDLGWTQDNTAVEPLFKGLTNEELWLLVRRFDKQIFGVRRIKEVSLGGLDLQASPDEVFNPDKLRAQLERLYMSNVVAGATFFKHIARLRSWNEKRRTIGFLVAYVVLWFFDMILPGLFLLLMVLTAYKPSRHYLFPPVPVALVSASKGSLQKPKAGSLGSHDSLTGAPEAYKGQAVEAEAANFVSGLGSVAVATALGKGEGRDGNAGEEGAKSGMDTGLPDPAGAMAAVADARGTATKSKPDAIEDKTKDAVQNSIWGKAGPFLRILVDINDSQERLANALSPAPPFSHWPKYRLASIFLPLVFATALTPAHLVAKGLGAGIGFGFFGQPYIDLGLHWLNTNIPDWPKYLQIQNTLLAGVPSNAQLCIALLRIGEANKTPIPPPPAGHAAPPEQPTQAEISAVSAENPLGNHAEIAEMAAPPPYNAEEERKKQLLKTEEKPQKGSRLVGLMKGTAKAGITSMLGADRIKATVGSDKSKQRLGVLPKDDTRKQDGPSHFACRHHGKKGRAWITTTAITPSLSYSKGVDGGADTLPTWTIQLDDIVELRKIGGLGFKSKLIVGAILHQEMADAIEIVDVEGHTYRLTAIQRRDELFNRLASLGQQRWETV